MFVGRRGGVQQLYVRRLDAIEARLLPNTEGAEVPTVSSDGQWVAFWARGMIKKVPIGGGPAMDFRKGARLRLRYGYAGGGRVFFSKDKSRAMRAVSG